ncbi:MAG TPA: hypothetical protein VK459_21885, partial [Polyangiaceae bacterium]|nr:hypothetical protein [Polyangiaceae bacterium]
MRTTSAAFEARGRSSRGRLGGGRDGYCSESDAKIITSKVSVRLEYAVAKLACEVALMNMTKVSDLFAVIIRPFNI